MNSFVNSMNAAASGMRAQGFRMRVVSENIANADTPGYRRKLLSFNTVMDSASRVSLVSPGRMSLDQSALEESYDPTHPMADENGNVAMSNVKLMVEMADGREANRSYEANLATFQQARQMYANLLDVLKR
jgi:flagellar basal-body rod protein FlgC